MKLKKRKVTWHVRALAVASPAGGSAGFFRLPRMQWRLVAPKTVCGTGRAAWLPAPVTVAPLCPCVWFCVLFRLCLPRGRHSGWHPEWPCVCMYTPNIFGFFLIDWYRLYARICITHRSNRAYVSVLVVYVKIVSRYCQVPLSDEATKKIKRERPQSITYMIQYTYRMQEYPSFFKLSLHSPSHVRARSCDHCPIRCRHSLCQGNSPNVVHHRPLKQVSQTKCTPFVSSKKLPTPAFRLPLPLTDASIEASLIFIIAVPNVPPFSSFTFHSFYWFFFQTPNQYIYNTLQAPKP